MRRLPVASKSLALLECQQLTNRVKDLLTLGIFSDSGDKAKALSFKTKLRVLLAEHEQPLPAPAPSEEEDDE